MSVMTQSDYTKAALVIIDPQNCFMDIPGMPLSVVGATADMARLASHMRKHIRQGLYEQVYVTLDTHPLDHISHAMRWVDQNGNHPALFTIITSDEYEAGMWCASADADQIWQGEYLKRLSRPHCIWPVHGQKGQIEHGICYELGSSIHEMGNPNGSPGLDEYVPFTYVEKGMHREVEQFGVFGADVPYPGAPETDINQSLIDDINRYSEIVFTGEASSHCVMDSVNQFLANVPEADWSKVVVLRDCMSPVPQPPGGPDFPAMAEFWFAGLETKGVRVVNVADYEVSKLAA